MGASRRSPPIATSRASGLTSRLHGWSKLRSMKPFISSVVELGDEADEAPVAGRFGAPADPVAPRPPSPRPRSARRACCRPETAPGTADRPASARGDRSSGRPPPRRPAPAVRAWSGRWGRCRRCSRRTSRRPARPPGTSARSTTVTARPAPARCRAAESPASPAPTTTTESVRPGTVRTRVLTSSGWAGGRR